MADPDYASCDCWFCREPVLPYQGMFDRSDRVALSLPAGYSPRLTPFRYNPYSYNGTSTSSFIVPERIPSSLGMPQFVRNQRLPPPERTPELPEWIPQASNPTIYSKVTFIARPEWIAQSKDPTACSKEAPIAQPEWIAQAKDPTTYSKGISVVQPEWIPQAKDPATYSKGASIAQPGWIPQAKDPTTYSKGASIAQSEWIPQAKDPTTYPKGISNVQPEWIPQAKDLATCSKWPSIAQLTSPNFKQAMRRSDTNNRSIGHPASPAATPPCSIVSRISTFWHRCFQSQEAHRNDESAMTRGISPTSSTTLCPKPSDIATPSSRGNEYPLLQLPPEVELLTSKRSSESSEWIPQAKDPTLHSEGTAILVKQAAPSFIEASHLSDDAFKVTPTVPSPSSGVIQEDFVRDLTGLVRLDQRTYRGQYSDVYKGMCDELLVAIKVIKALRSDPLHAVRRRVRREVGTASRFNHPNVLAVYGVIEADWCEFGGIVTLWCPNGDASSYLRSNPLTPSARLLMVCGVAAGLEHIHSLSLVHGDLKPGNILIDASGNPLICDFGLVCILDGEQPDWVADSTTTVHVGTVRYLAYELAKDPPESRTMASDIHALGCVTYEFLYLERPYATRDGNNAELYIFRDIAAGISPAPRPPSPLSTSVSALWHLIECCWAKEPHQRPIISTFSHSSQLLTEGDLHLHLHGY